MERRDPVSSLAEFKTALDNLRAELVDDKKDKNVNNAGRDVYEDYNKIYEKLLLKSSLKDEEDIKLFTRCINNAAGAVKHQGTETARYYVEELIKNANEVSAKGTHYKHLGGVLILLAGAVVAGLALGGIPFALGISAAAILLALGAASVFKKNKSAEKISQLSTQTGKTIDYLSEDQKTLMQIALKQIKAGQFSEDLLGHLYDATKGKVEVLRNFIVQHILPHLTDKELFLLTKAMMEYHVAHRSNDASILRTSEALTTHLYGHYLNRIRYSPRDNPQPPTMIVLNQIVYDYMQKTGETDPVNAAVVGIAFKCEYWSTRREALKKSLTGDTPVVHFDEEEKALDTQKRMNKLNQSLSLRVTKEKKEFSYNKETIHRLDAMNEMVKDMENWSLDMKNALSEFVKIAYTNVQSDVKQEQKFFQDIDKVYESLTNLDNKKRLSFLDSACKRITNNNEFCQKMAICLVQIAFEEVNEVKKLYETEWKNKNAELNKIPESSEMRWMHGMRESNKKLNEVKINESAQQINQIYLEGERVYQEIKNDSVQLAQLASMLTAVTRLTQDSSIAGDLYQQISSITIPPQFQKLQIDIQNFIVDNMNANFLSGGPV